MCIFRNAHVYAHKQQLAGQPLTLGCNPQWTASETHMCVCVLTAAIGLLKLLDVQNLHLAR